jgi:hypothetical protein
MEEPLGVMEWWSDGVMKRLLTLKLAAFSNTPILPYSSTPKQVSTLTGKATFFEPALTTKSFKLHSYTLSKHGDPKLLKKFSFP